MARAGIILEMQGKQAALERTLAQQAKLVQQYEQRLRALGVAAKEAGAEQKRMASDAARVIKEVQTPLERYEQKIKSLKGHLSSGRISQDQYNRAVTQARAAMESSLSPLDRHKAKVDQLSASLKRGEMTQRQYRQAVSQANAQLRQQQAAAAGANGPGMLAGLKSMIGGYLSMAAAIGTVVAALRDQRQLEIDAAQRAKEARMGIGSLAQLANDDAHYKELVAKAKSIHQQGGSQSIDEAAQIVFSLESAGAIEYLDLFTEMKKTGLVADPATMAKAAKTLQTSMGEKETGSFRDLVSKAFGASKFSPATAEALLEGASRGGSYARALEITDEEVLAAMAPLATASGSAELGGTQLRSLLASLDMKNGRTIADVLSIDTGELSNADKVHLAELQETIDTGDWADRQKAQEQKDEFLKRKKAMGELVPEAYKQTMDFRGKSLQEQLDMITSAGLEGDELFKFLGRKEAVTAYRVLADNREKYQEALTAVRDAQATDAVAGKLRLPQIDEEQAAAIEAAAAQGKRDIALGGAGAASNRIEAAMRNIEAEQYASGDVTARSRLWVAGRGVGTMQAVVGSETTENILGTSYFQAMTGGLFQDTLRTSKNIERQTEILEQVAKTNERTATAIERQVNQPAGPALVPPGGDR